MENNNFNITQFVNQTEIDSIPHNEPIPMDNGAYLLVRDRKWWFRDYCTKKGVSGFIQTERLPRDVDTTVSDFKGDSCFRSSVVTENVKATIYINGVPVSTAHGSASNLGGYNVKALENAETAAIGRALDLLGFNLRAAAPENGEYDGYAPSMSADSPIPAPPLMAPGQQYQPVNPAAPAAPAMPQGYVAPPAPPAAAPTMPVNPWENQDEVEKAKAFIVPTGNFKNQSVGEMHAQSEWHVRFYANMIPDKNFGSAKRFPEFVEACRTVWLSQHPEG